MSRKIRRIKMPIEQNVASYTQKFNFRTKIEKGNN